MISEMVSSKVVNICYNANDPDSSLNRTIDLNRYKLFLLDTGLFVTLMFKNGDVTDNVIYKKLLSNNLETNLGFLYENMVSQILISKGYNLFYHQFKDADSKKYYKVDFIVNNKNKIIPIEVKSSGYKRHKSLDRFSDKYKSKISEKYVIYNKDFLVEEGITYLPIYMAYFI